MYPVPKGGVPALYALASVFSEIVIVNDLHEADIIFDDIIDSGATAERFLKINYGGNPKPFLALINKQEPFINQQQHLIIRDSSWIVFPWENDGENETSIESNIIRILQYVGEDTSRGGLLETPKRVAKAWKDWASGYDAPSDEEILKVFEDGGESYNQMVTVKDIPIYSKCEHHLADIFGTCTISYIPNGKIVGLSKLSRIANKYSKRLQVQERLTDQIADSLFKHLEPIAVGVQIKARHMCMESRGICQQGHHTITTSLRGAMLTDPTARAEFLSVANQ